MKFPNKNEIKKILKELESVDPALVIDFDNASPSDVAKYRLCQEFVKYLKQEAITQAELAKRLDIDKAIVNKIVLHRIDYFTIDRLLDLLAKVKKIDVLFKAS